MEPSLGDMYDEIGVVKMCIDDGGNTKKRKIDRAWPECQADRYSVRQKNRES